MPFLRRQLSLRQVATPALYALWLAGCASRGNIDILESELRHEERLREELADQLGRSREELKVARSDADSLRTQLAERRQVALSPDQAEVFYRAEAIKFNMLLTSGQERDGLPGDDALSVLVTPVDSHGDLVKLAGEVELDLFDMTLPSDRQRLGHWTFPMDEVREHWHKGFLSAGYLFQVDWKAVPVSPELTLHARMTVADGRQFDATTQVKVTPPGSGSLPLVRAPGRLSRDLLPPRVSAADSARKEQAEDGKDNVRLMNGGAGATDIPPAAKPPVIRPAAKAGHSNPSTLTSDTWTEATIPRLR
jgi:hypothetical protein